MAAPNLGARDVVRIIGAMEKSTHTREYALVRAKLKASRDGAQLSQRALAERLGVPHSWIAKVEAGKRRVDFVELCWIVAACEKHVPRALAELAKKIVAMQARRQGRPRTATDS